jgi:hypothetical protein
MNNQSDQIRYRKKQFKTAVEDPEDILVNVSFSVMWYGILLVSVAYHRMDPVLATLFAAACLLINRIEGKEIPAMLTARARRTQLIRSGQKAPGRIIDIETVTHKKRYHGRDVYFNHYIYTIRFIDGSGFDFRTPDYRRPIHLLLADPDVTVCSMGREHVITDFHVRKHLGDAGPFSARMSCEQILLSVYGRTLRRGFFAICVLGMLIFYMMQV